MGVGNVFSNTAAMSIRSLLESNVKFVVPRFQRNYAWGEDQTLRLWDDLVENFSTYVKARQKSDTNLLTESQYLLGSIVLVPGDGHQEFFVIDGQQRLATLTILFCAMRDILNEDLKKYKGAPPVEAERAKRQMEDLIDGFTRYGVGVDRPWKLVLNDVDKDTFKIIQRYEDDDDSTQYERIHKRLKANSKISESERHIYENYVSLHNEITDALESGFTFTRFNGRKKLGKKKNTDKYEQGKVQKRVDNTGALRDFLSYVANDNFVVQVMIDNDNTAFQVFETLNSRGSDLAKSNLIKNHILSKVGHDKNTQEALSRKWDTIFSDTIGEQDHDEFVLESLRSRNKKSDRSLTTKNIYKIVKDDLKEASPEKCERFVQDLKDDAEFIATLNNPKTADDAIRDAVYGMQFLRAKLVRFPIVAAQRGRTIDSDLGQLADLLLKFFFKARIVSREHPGEIDRIMTSVTEKILEMPDASIAVILPEVKKIIKERNGDEHEYFLSEFNRFMRKPKKDTARYVLYQLNKELSPAFSGVKPTENLTLEHILPKKNDKWKEEDFFGEKGSGKSLKDYVDRLGNLTLLELPPNAAVKDKKFSEKMDHVGKGKNAGKQLGYKGSKLPLNTKTVLDKSEWTEEAVMNREVVFHDLANKVWKLDV